jgi:hypothetical protein
MTLAPGRTRRQVGSRAGTFDAWEERMRTHTPAVVLVVLAAACGGASSTRAPNPADKPGGAVNMQPGSGGTYGDVVRSEGNEPPTAPTDTAPAATAPVAPAEPPAKEPPPPHPRS